MPTVAASEERLSDEAERCAQALREVLATPSARTRRLLRPGVGVRFATDGGGGFVLVPEGDGLAVEASGSFEIEVRFATGAMDAFATGDLAISGAALDGRATVEGSGLALREFLAVSPILTGLLHDRRDPDATPSPARPSAPRPAEDTLPPEMWSIGLEGVHKSFGSHDVLRGVDLRIPEGSITVLLGPSGTGKSVVIKHLIGLLRPDRGEVAIHGRQMSRMSVTETLDLRRRYGVLFQDGALFGSMNVYDNVAFPLRQHTDLDEPSIERVVRRRLDEVGLLGAAELAPGQISGGMKKRVGFARALALDPDIVLFDEPDSGLDPVRTSLLSDLVLNTHPRYGGTYVVITHNISVAEKLGQYLALLYDGKIVAAGTRDEIFGSDDPFVSQFLRGAPEGPLGMD